jgi:hypothetical protein
VSYSAFKIAFTLSTLFLANMALPALSRADVPEFTVTNPKPPDSFGGSSLFGKTGTIEGDIFDARPLDPTTFSVSFTGGSTSTIVSRTLSGNHFVVVFNLALSSSSEGVLGTIIPSGLSPGGYIARVSSAAFSISDIDGNTTDYFFPIYIDDRPPGLSVNLPMQNGSVAPFSKLAGTVTDFSPVNSLTLQITDAESDPTYWWDGTKFTTNPVTLDAEYTAGSSAWSYAGFSSDDTAGVTSVLALTGTDSFGNVDTSTTTISVQPAKVQTTLASVALNARGVNFSPSNLTIQWGGYDAETINVSFDGVFAAFLQSVDPNWANFVVVQNDDGNLALSQNTPGAIGVKSQRNSCATSGTINVYYRQSLVASTVVAIQTPTSTLATNLRRNLTQHQGNLKDSLPKECAFPEDNPASRLCRADLWDVFVVGGPPQFLSKLYVREDQSEGHSIEPGTPPCAGSNDVNFDFVQLGNITSVTDTQGYDPLYSLVKALDGLFQNCGEASTQGFTFASRYTPLTDNFFGAGVDSGTDTRPYATCQFFPVIQKTKFIGPAPALAIETNRSDVRH